MLLKNINLKKLEDILNENNPTFFDTSMLIPVVIDNGVNKSFFRYIKEIIENERTTRYKELKEFMDKADMYTQELKNVIEKYDNIILHNLVIEEKFDKLFNFTKNVKKNYKRKMRMHSRNIEEFSMPAVYFKEEIRFYDSVVHRLSRHEKHLKKMLKACEKKEVSFDIDEIYTKILHIVKGKKAKKKFTDEHILTSAIYQSCRKEVSTNIITKDFDFCFNMRNSYYELIKLIVDLRLKADLKIYLLRSRKDELEPRLVYHFKCFKGQQHHESVILTEQTNKKMDYPFKEI